MTIFIDIDGVLVTDWSMKQDLIGIDEFTYYEPYDPESVSALNKLIKSFDPSLVIHSSRRYQYTESDFRTIWSQNGIQYNSLKVLPKFSEKEDKFFSHPNEEKEYDLKRYIALKSIKPDDFLVLEDEKLNINNLYVVDGSIGLTIRDADSIIKNRNRK